LLTSEEAAAIRQAVAFAHDYQSDPERFAALHTADTTIVISA